MKALRIVHVVFGVLAMAMILVIVWWIVASAVQRGESSRTQAAWDSLATKLEAYRRTNGRYPDSLVVLEFTNSLQELQMQPAVKKMNYHRTETGYVLSYEGSPRLSLSVSGHSEIE